eukprot:1109301-Lingulodinium_polyedra.AAC.1
MDTVVEAKATSFTHAKSTTFRSHVSPAGMSNFGSSVSCFQFGLQCPLVIRAWPPPPCQTLE